MEKAKFSFTFVVLLLTIASGGMLSGVKGGKLPLPRCRVNSDCFPICQSCGFCACLSGICCSGCGGGPGGGAAGHPLDSISAPKKGMTNTVPSP
ncbi:hypothetical protein Vadar_005761 [Vaccinium darrowii]|uniref:Uncharacterized protein n=1 Tax=Vaccinium darrowii TaxID=229202 RepID=A0ACB7WYF4_9ERIC|nr:hypothetical protein Vadar_005761 [Vaccinium darrowii]